MYIYTKGLWSYRDLSNSYVVKSNDVTRVYHHTWAPFIDHVRPRLGHHVSTVAVVVVLSSYVTWKGHPDDEEGKAVSKDSIWLVGCNTCPLLWARTITCVITWVLTPWVGLPGIHQQTDKRPRDQDSRWPASFQNIHSKILWSTLQTSSQPVTLLLLNHGLRLQVLPIIYGSNET